MYGKIFEQMYDGSLACGEWEGLITMQQLIVLADADGVVDMTARAISVRTTVPLEIINKGLKLLQRPDPDSRSKAHDGRRIVLLDDSRTWGWKLVNYSYYAGLATREDKKRKDRQRIAEKRSKNNSVAGCRNVSQDVAKVAHIDVDVDVDVNKNMSEADDDDFIVFWKTYPRKDDKKKASVSWRRLSKTKKEKALADAKLRYSGTEKKYIPLATTYIDGERWDDETRQTSVSDGAI